MNLLAVLQAGRRLGWHGRLAHVFQTTGRMPVPLRLPLRPSRIAMAFSLGVFVLSALRAETVVNVPTAPEADVTIRLSAPWTQIPRFGFAPVRVTIENRARGERTWRIRFEAGGRYLYPGVLSTEETISVPAGQTRDVWVFVPLAEPGVVMVPSGGMGMGMSPPPVVAIANTPTGKKVTVTRSFGGGSVYVTETDIDTATGTVTTKSMPSTSPASTRVRKNPLNPGTTVTFTIDPTSGDVMTGVWRNAGSTAPGVAKIVMAPGSPTPGGTPPAIPGSAFVPSSPSMLMADVSGPGVETGHQMFPTTAAANAMRPFAVSAALESVLRGNLSTLMGGAPNLSVVDIPQLPADWRVWSSFSGVVITSDEYASLDAARRSALRAWVALGGQLYLSPPAKTAATGTQLVQNEKLGAGTVVTFSEPLGTVTAGETASTSEAALRMQAEVAARRAARRPGAATTQVMPVVTAETAALVKDLQLFAGTAALPDREALTLESGALSEFVKDQAMDNTWLGVFLIVFAIVVGPVNLFVFAPAQKRHRLFVTTPAIALAASLILGITILMQDGTGGSGDRRVFVSLLPGENAAAVVQEQAARTGFLTRRAFALPDDVTCTMLPLEAAPAFYNVSLSLQFERSHGSAGGDWFQSRARQAHQLRRIVPTRARIEAVGVAPNGAPIVQSSLGTTLREFYFIDAAGHSWSATTLPSGQRVTLQATAAGLDLEASRGGSGNLRAIVGNSAAHPTGQWWAKGGATELAPIPTLRSIHWKESDVIYTGTVENAAAVLGAKTGNAERGAR